MRRRTGPKGHHRVFGERSTIVALLLASLFLLSALCIGCKDKDASISDIRPAETTLLGIYQVKVAEITTTAVRITWKTGRPATSQVEYGTNTSYGWATLLDEELTENHNVTLDGLTPTTTYHFRAKSKDSTDNEVASPDLAFTTTTPASDNPPPANPSAPQGQNTPPTVDAGPDVIINPGTTFSRKASFKDPDADAWVIVVDYGDGSDKQALPLSQDHTFALSRVYAKEGTYTVTVTVSDNHDTSGTDTLIVTVARSEIQGAIDMIRRIPPTADSFIFADTAAMRSDPELAPLYSDIEQQFNSLGAPGVLFSDVNQFVAVKAATVFRGALMEGRFDLSQMEPALRSAGFVASQYGDVEAWATSDNSTWMTLIDSLIIIGEESHVKGCIDVIRTGDGSLYDNPNFKAIVDRLPQGIVMSCSKGALFNRFDYRGMEVWGFSLVKREASSLGITAFCSFDGEYAAQETLDDITSDLQHEENSVFRDLDITRDRDILRMTGDGSVAELVTLLP